ncbi:hypothetical protein [Serratia rubidaea]|uniref:hypothetical protein n=1 Tax=Serratia rubidaea TaxID=61652 RepID=UPI0024328F88|nr:hypothetical protein [Serratia rubidaea]MCR0999937.1 hypothetical protein [Serratia rubidaea]
METIRRLYLAKFGETVDGLLRLDGSWEMRSDGANIEMNGENEMLPRLGAYYWLLFKDLRHQYSDVFAASSHVKLRLLNDAIVPFKPFTDQATNYSVNYAYTSRTGSRGQCTITRELTKRPAG